MFIFPREWTARLRVLKLLTTSLFFSAVLVGCATNPSPPPVQPPPITKYVVVQPSADLVADCDITAVPPDPDSFMAAIKKPDPTEAYGLLSDYASSQQADMRVCNARWKKFREWLSSQTVNYAAPPAP